MKVLVTGSSGRIGRAMVTRLLERGDTVCGLDIRASGRDEDSFDEVVGKFDDASAVTKAVQGMDAVLHLGAFMSWAPSERTQMFQANVEGTRVIAEAASDAGVKRFVFASSGEVYPENVPEFLPVNEEHPLHANSPYGLTKLLGEEVIRFHQRQGKMETVILRFSHTQDADELLDEASFFSGPRFFLRPRITQQENFGNHAVADILRAADPGHPSHILARNENGRPFMMHITETRDIVSGVVLALESADAVGQAFNLGATDPVDFEALLSNMSDATGLPVTTVDLPENVVYYQTSNEKIRNMLGFSPEWTIERMLAQAAQSWKARKME